MAIAIGVDEAPPGSLVSSETGLPVSFVSACRTGSMPKWALRRRDIWQKRQQEYAARLAALDRKTRQCEADRAAHRTAAAGLEQQIRLAGAAEGIYQTLVARQLASKLKLVATTEQRVEAKAQLSTTLGEQQQLRQEIKVGRRSLLQYLLNPITRIAPDSLRKP